MQIKSEGSLLKNALLFYSGHILIERDLLTMKREIYFTQKFISFTVNFIQNYLTKYTEKDKKTSQYQGTPSPSQVKT